MNLAVLLVTAATILHASSGNPQFRRGGGWNPIPDETSSEVQGTVPKRPIFVTDTRSSILLLHSSIQRLSDNLGRHDTRVRQMSEQLRVVRDSQRSAEKSIESIAILLQRLDSRLGNMEAQMAALEQSTWNDENGSE
ncbi:unnamed protein product [Cyprideis torosa]|uniref:Uncharacterized protein n=1 Tax=Cyprideis torosa TaxID=163714 RepID=A0A7R8ZQF0_9CRUS|nr:unnamed protein product [Cyprideis torosa]CAG0891918.1 unnamed protein product [Cyprideis torosa]